MKRIKLIVAYDGTKYHGWQIQPGDITVEQIINEKLSQLTGEEIKVIGASRTDSGVHAMGNVAVFDTESRIPGETFEFSIQKRLLQISIQDIVIVAKPIDIRFGMQNSQIQCNVCMHISSAMSWIW